MSMAVPTGIEEQMCVYCSRSTFPGVCVCGQVGDAVQKLYRSVVEITMKAEIKGGRGPSKGAGSTGVGCREGAIGIGLP